MTDRRFGLTTLGKFSRVFAAMIIVSLLSIWVIFAAIAYDFYRAEWSNASLIANNVVNLLQRDIARNIELYDLSIKAVLSNLSDPRVQALPDDLKRGVLFDQSIYASGLGSILVIDATGNIMVDSRNVRPKAVNLADRDYFIAQRDSTNKDALIISRPFQSRVSGSADWSIGFTRRVSNPDGGFGGLVIGSVRLSYFLSLYKDTRLPPDSTVSLMDVDGRMIVNTPFEPSQIGTVDREATTAFLKDGIAAGETVSGVERSHLIVYKQIGALPLIQGVGLSVEQILAHWRLRIAVLAAAFLALSGVIVLLGLLLRGELRRRAALELTLSNLAATDGLTSLANRRRFDEALDMEWRRAARDGSDLSLLMIDCDHFKNFNDVYGHLKGDAALRAVALAIKSSISRPGDLAARFGGEEFTVLLPATNHKGALVIAGAIRSRLQRAAIPHRDSPQGIVTVSIGIASDKPVVVGSCETLVQAADIALYGAKAAGRNAVVSAPRHDEQERLNSIVSFKPR